MIKADSIIEVGEMDKHVQLEDYIQGGDGYTFQLENGTYQPFFYLGKGCNPNKEVTDQIQVGFMANESLSKDNPQEIEDCRLT